MNKPSNFNLDPTRVPELYALEMRIERAYNDYYRGAIDQKPNTTNFLRDAPTMFCFGIIAEMCEYYNDEARAFYGDAYTVNALMNCNH